MRLYGCGARRRRLHDLRLRHVLRGHDDDVVIGLQVPLGDALLVDQVERNPELVERVTVPAEFLRALPLRVDRDARDVGVVRRDGRRRR